MASGNFTQEEIRRRLKSKGFVCSKNGLNKLLRNSVYAGRLFVPAFKDESECYIKGVHEPIIDEGLFLKVQGIINGRKPINTTKKHMQRRISSSWLPKVLQMRKVVNW